MTDTNTEAPQQGFPDPTTIAMPVAEVHMRIEHLLRLQAASQGMAMLAEGIDRPKVVELLRDGHQRFVAELEREANLEGLAHDMTCPGGHNHATDDAIDEAFRPGTYL